MRFGIGDIAVLRHSTRVANLKSILDNNSLLSASELVKRNIQYIPGFGDNKKDSYTYLQPIREMTIPRSKERDPDFTYNSFMVHLYFRPTILKDREDWLANKIWTGKITEDTMDKNTFIVAKLSERSEIMFPKVVDLDRYLVAIGFEERITILRDDEVVFLSCPEVIDIVGEQYADKIVNVYNYERSIHKR
jgi:hypothetical protein